MFSTLFTSKKSNEDMPSSSQTKKAEEPVTTSTSSAFASIVTPTGKKNLKKPATKKVVSVKSHTRSLRKGNGTSKMKSIPIKVGTIVCRSFKTWPTSRKPGDPPVSKNFRGMVTEINPTSKKVHVLFENSQNMRFDVKDLIPLILKENVSQESPEEKKIPAYLKNIRSINETEVSDLESFVSKNEEDEGEADMETTTVSYNSDDDDDVVYIKTKKVPDVTFIKVVPGDKPYADKEITEDDTKNTNVITLM
jgi:hypothetical protein